MCIGREGCHSPPLPWLLQGRRRRPAPPQIQREAPGCWYLRWHVLLAGWQGRQRQQARCGLAASAVLGAGAELELVFFGAMQCNAMQDSGPAPKHDVALLLLDRCVAGRCWPLSWRGCQLAECHGPACSLLPRSGRGAVSAPGSCSFHVDASLRPCVGFDTTVRCTAHCLPLPATAAAVAWQSQQPHAHPSGNAGDGGGPSDRNAHGGHGVGTAEGRRHAC